MQRVLGGALLAGSVFMAVPSMAQTATRFGGGAVPVDDYHDLSMLKAPAGSKVAIIVFEDLGCPGCARAHPIEEAVAQKEHVPLVRYDFPIQAHIWTYEAAVFARYLQDKVNPGLADQYRTDVFLAQMQIASKDDLHTFNQRWMQKHGQTMPFVIDPTGALGAQVQADYAKGMKLGLQFTPTIIVATHDRYQVVAGLKTVSDPTQLDAVVQAALSQGKGNVSPHKR